jgi:hypothetical protein
MPLNFNLSQSNEPIRGIAPKPASIAGDPGTTTTGSGRKISRAAGFSPTRPAPRSSSPPSAGPRAPSPRRPLSLLRRERDRHGRNDSRRNACRCRSSSRGRGFGLRSCSVHHATTQHDDDFYHRSRRWWLRSVYTNTFVAFAPPGAGGRKQNSGNSARLNANQSNLGSNASSVGGLGATS